ncbi:dihydrofolate reductase family protein [Conexibacter sp. S30A1]|uniref:dihydrofolate reductase family protein n=1 Tax=Conexibacter sp. S30A1 TaxID=2937800 RepID=UPI00200D6448|nr:dihydrofolate reductase family protein [Conexibacter sp. S30A1]
MEATAYRQLLPPGGPTDARTHVEALMQAAVPERSERPYTLVNFVTSLDGHTTIGPDSRGLSGGADRELFYALRERADAVLAGPRTLAAERYKRMLPAPERRARRLAQGRPAEPLLVSISSSGQVPLDVPLFAAPEARALIFSPDPPVAARLAATVVHAPLAPLGQALRTLRADDDVKLLLCEGGPTLFGALLAAGLADELWLTLAPRLVGGASGAALLSGAAPQAPTRAQLAGVLEHAGTLFLRYRLWPERR